MIYVLSPTQPTPLASHQQPTQTNQIAFCHSGEKIFVSTSEGRVRILSYPKFEPVLHLEHGGEPKEFTLKGHTSSCLATELQPMGRWLATGGADSIIALWDTRDWVCERTITRMVGPVRCISTLQKEKAHRCLPVFSSCRSTGRGVSSSQNANTNLLGFTFDGSYVVGGSDEGMLQTLP